MDSPEGTAALDPLDELLSVLDLTHLGEAHVRVEGVEGDEESDLGESVADVFVGESQKMPHGRVFGGQVLAQAVMAAGRTVQGVGHDVRPGRSTPCTATSSGPATTATRSGSRWTRSATAAPSRRGASRPSSTASRSSR